MAQLDYNNAVALDTGTTVISGNSSAQINIVGEAKLFKAKYAHQENENSVNGDDVGFTIVFGNDGDLTWEQPRPNIPTLEDTLSIDSPVDLKLVHLSLPCDFQLWVLSRDGVELTNPRQVEVCDIFNSGTYVLQLRKLVDGEYTPYFNIPCNSIESFSILFQVRFANCPPCDDDCSNEDVFNGDFELPPFDTENIVTGWTAAVSATGDPFAKTVASANLINSNTGFNKNYTPVSGNYFALLKTNGPSGYTTISQTIEVCPGDTIQGYAFFFTTEPFSGVFYSDNARIRILDENNVVVAVPFDKSGVNTPPAYGSTDWLKWSYTFTEGGIYTIEHGVINALDSEGDSYIGIDAVEIV
ncbi:Uncharacterised protein [uncultured Clostridium sp.]|uniref:hypothetical protein n=1 Tax=uncultured Clostridium sp. TaxID=59620 RepID=UPI000821EDE7|nr:hypothetical protein [uncultured Clostridium sp.]SCI74678.1 Uncharacterised protein [uncultured Clostridium sp.]